MASGTPKTNTYKNCVTREKPDKDPFSQPHQKCTWTVMTSTGSKMDSQGTCVGEVGGQETKTDVEVHIIVLNSENVKGTGKLAMTAGGHTMKVSYAMTSKYLGATCGDTH